MSLQLGILVNAPHFGDRAYREQESSQVLAASGEECDQFVLGVGSFIAERFTTVIQSNELH